MLYQISKIIKAANEHCLNVMPPKLIIKDHMQTETKVRSILDCYSLTYCKILLRACYVIYGAVINIQ